MSLVPCRYYDCGSGHSLYKVNAGEGHHALCVYVCVTECASEISRIIYVPDR